MLWTGPNDAPLSTKSERIAELKKKLALLWASDNGSTKHLKKIMDAEIELRRIQHKE